MNRLQYELHERKRIKQQVEEMNKKKGSVADQILTKKKFLAGLPTQVKTIMDSTKPLQKYFNTNVHETEALQESVRLLPTPLYLLYHDVQHYKDNVDSTVSLIIEGNEQDARQYWKTEDDKYLIETIKSQEKSDEVENGDNDEDGYERPSKKMRMV